MEPQLAIEKPATPKEMAEILTVSRQTIVIWANQGKIPVIKISPKTWRFDVAKVFEALEADG